MSKRRSGSNPGGHHFHIQNIERDIHRGYTSSQMAEKYGKNPEEIVALVENAYSNNPSKVRELKNRLKSSDDSAMMRMARSKESVSQETKEPDVNVSVVSEETTYSTPVSQQRERVENASEALIKAKAELKSAITRVAEAERRQQKAKEALRLAEQAKYDADDEFRQATSIRFSAERRRDECMEALEKENECLAEMLSIPKLYHASALKGGVKQLEGTIYVTEYDFENLIDPSVKQMVIPVNTTGLTLKKYPQEFYTYPAEMGMTGYTSACHFAMAYIKLRSGEDGDKLEVMCPDKIVMELAVMQEVE